MRMMLGHRVFNSANNMEFIGLLVYSDYGLTGEEIKIVEG